jgi:hypothetical protein
VFSAGEPKSPEIHRKHRTGARSRGRFLLEVYHRLADLSRSICVRPEISGHVETEDRRRLPFIYGLRNAARVAFDPERDQGLMSSVREAIVKRTKIIS